MWNDLSASQPIELGVAMPQQTYRGYICWQPYGGQKVCQWLPEPMLLGTTCDAVGLGLSQRQDSMIAAVFLGAG